AGLPAPHVSGHKLSGEALVSRGVLRLRTVSVNFVQAPSPLEPPQSPDLLDPSFGDPIGRLVGGYPLLRREREEADERVIDIARLSHRLVPVPPLQLPVYVDEAARVDHVVQ